MIACPGIFSFKVLKHNSDVIIHSSDVVIHGFHIRVMFVSSISQGFDVIVNVF